MPSRMRARLILGAMVIGILVVSIVRGWFLVPFSLTVRVSAPIVLGIAHAGRTLTDVASSFLRIGKLSRSIRILEEENARLTSLVARLESVEEENAVLRNELKLLPRTQFRLVTADVVSYSTDGTSSALLINRGTRDGIEASMPVIVSDGVLVGQVRSVGPASAVVALVADPSVRASAKTIGTKAEGLLQGVRGLEIILDKVPRTATLTPGDRLVTTGTDGVFPPYLFIGTIATVDAPRNDIFQSALVTSAVPIQRLRVVSVLLRP